jgi:hypothetical protein
MARQSPFILLAPRDAEADGLFARIGRDRLVEEFGAQQKRIGDIDGTRSGAALARPQKRRLAQAFEAAGEDGIGQTEAEILPAEADGCKSRAARPIDRQ